MIGIGNKIDWKNKGINWSSYWATLISATVEDASPTNIVLTFPSAKTSLVASDFTATLNGVAVAINSASWTGAVLTLVIADTVIYGDVVVVTFVRTGETANVTNNINAEAELILYASYPVTPLSDTEKKDINDLIIELKSGLSINNLSDFFDFLRVLACEGSECYLKNLVKDAYHAIPQGTPPPTHIDGEGIHGDGANGYLNDNFNTSTGVNFTKNSNALGLYCRNDVQSASMADIGVQTSSTARSGLLIRLATDEMSARMNAADARNMALDSLGTFIGTRTASDVEIAYNNEVRGTINAAASTNLVNLNVFTCARNLSGSPDSLSTRQYAFTFASKGMTADQVKIVGTAFNNYMIKKGKEVVYPLEGVIANAAHCWFARKRALYDASAGKTWIGLVTNTGGGYLQHILTINNSTGVVTPTQVGTTVKIDDHDEPSLLIRSSDNKIFTCYSEHNNNVNLRYRISTNALDASAWGAESQFTGDSEVSYGSCFEATNGDIFVFYRENTAGWCYIKSSDGGATFGGRTNFYFAALGLDQGYFIPAQSPLDKDVIHFILSSGHPQTGSNLSIYAGYFDCGLEKFYQLDGTDVTAHIPLTSTHLTTIKTNTNPDGAWIEDIIVDSTGKPRYLLTQYPNGKNINYATKDLYYAEWDGSAITTPHKIHTETTGTISAAEPTYMPCSCFDQNDPNIIIASKDVDSISEIHKITRVASDSFTSEQLTENSHYDQWRPFTTKGGNYNVFWLRKRKYVTYTQFIQSLIMDTI